MGVLGSGGGFDTLILNKDWNHLNYHGKNHYSVFGYLQVDSGLTSTGVGS